MPDVTCSSMNTCHGGGKKRGMVVKILAKQGHKVDVWEKGVKNVAAFGAFMSPLNRRSPVDALIRS